MKTSAQIRQETLHAKLVEASAQINVLEDTIAEARKELERKKKERDKVQKQLAQCKEDNGAAITISFHAMQRWLERTMLIDMKVVRAQILGEGLEEAIIKLGGNGKFPHPLGYTVIVKDYNIITITT